MKRILPGLVLLTGILLGVTACYDDCEDPVYPSIVLGTYLDEVSVTSFAGDTLWVHGLNRDSTILRTSKLYLLPFDLSGEETSIVVELKGQKDTLTLYYQTWLEFLSENCGCATAGVLDTVISTHHLIQNVEILNAGIGKTYSSGLKVNEENIRIHYLSESFPGE